MTRTLDCDFKGHSLGEAELTATAVPGRKSIVKTAMVRIAALSRIVAWAICRALLAISRFA